MTSAMESDPYSHTDGFWLGRLSAAIGEAVKMSTTDPRWTQRYLRETLREYVSSPVPAPEVRESLRKYLK